MSGNVSPRGPKPTRQNTANCPSWRGFARLAAPIGATVFILDQGSTVFKFPRLRRFRGRHLHEHHTKQAKKGGDPKKGENMTWKQRQKLTSNDEILQRRDCKDDARHRFCTVRPTPLRQIQLALRSIIACSLSTPPGHSPAPSLLVIYKLRYFFCSAYHVDGLFKRYIALNIQKTP